MNPGVMQNIAQMLQQRQMPMQNPNMQQLPPAAPQMQTPVGQGVMQNMPMQRPARGY